MPSMQINATNAEYNIFLVIFLLRTFNLIARIDFKGILQIFKTSHLWPWTLSSSLSVKRINQSHIKSNPNMVICQPHVSMRIYNDTWYYVAASQSVATKSVTFDKKIVEKKTKSKKIQAFKNVFSWLLMLQTEHIWKVLFLLCYS